MSKNKKSKRIDLSEKRKWNDIIRKVSKDDIPVEFLDILTINLRDDVTVTINVTQLLSEGYSSSEIERLINEELDLNEAETIDVTFYLNASSVKDTVDPLTKSILKNL